MKYATIMVTAMRLFSHHPIAEKCDFHFSNKKYPQQRIKSHQQKVVENISITKKIVFDNFINKKRLSKRLHKNYRRQLQKKEQK